MAKILKVKIGLTINGNKWSRTYPPEYDKTKIKVLSYESIGDPATLLARDDGTDYCIGVVSDADAATFLASADITELNQTDANTQGAVWRPQINRISDRSKALAILGKVHNNPSNPSLTQDEQNAINPDHAETGVNKSQAFSDLLTTTLASM